ncbi:MAG TPA: hypothetical protein VKR22_10110 [Acidimicrobiales bacterium]|nr:hypothetical protein [Acidimicrobiales bacterium]
MTPAMPGASGGLRGGFAGQVPQYPRTGPPGISHYVGKVNVGDVIGERQGRMGRIVMFHVDNLLYRNRKGALIGILQFFGEGAPMDLEKPGNLNVWVHPRRLRRGIATALVLEATRRWGPLPWDQQLYTPEGRALIEALQA